MKFRINKQSAESILKSFGKDSSAFEEIDLELISETATEAVMKQQLEMDAWHRGYHYGFREGYYSARNENRPFCCERGCKFSL